MDMEKVNADAARLSSKWAVDQAMDEWRAERQAQEEAEWDAKPAFEKMEIMASNAYDTASDIASSAADTIGTVATGVGKTVENVVDSIHQLGNGWENLHERTAALQKAMQTGDIAQIDAGVNDLQQAGQAFTNDAKGVILAPSKEMVRSFVNNYADRSGSPFQGTAQNIQQSDTYLKFHMTTEERLQKCREIQNVTNIPAEITSVDDKAFKAALEVYNFKQREEDIDKVWEEFPEVKNIADMDPEGAAIVLHNIDDVRKTHGIVESFTHFLNAGSIRKQHDELQFKIATGKYTDDDVARLKELKAQLENDKKKAPSFWDDPAAAMAAGVAESLPAMGEDMAVGAVLAALATVATGGTAALGAALVGGGARAVAMQTVRSQATKTVAKNMMKIGMFGNMGARIQGGDIAELMEYKDKDGKPVFTLQEARQATALQAAVESGIETAADIFSLGTVGKFIKPKTHLAQVVKDIEAQTIAKDARKNTIAELAGGSAKTWLKLTGAEVAEEGAQSVSNDLFTNAALDSKGEKASHIQRYSAADIAGRSIASMIEAIPAAAGFGIVGAGTGMVGRAGVNVRNARREARMAQTYGENAVHTMNGTIMVEQLQQAVASGKLKETAPDVQQKILREQLAGTGYEMAHIDVEMALQKENGVEDLKKVAKAAGMTSEELDAAISQQAYLNVPVEVLAQVESSPELLDTVTFKDNAESMARMRMNQKELTEAYNEAVKRTIDNRQQLIDNIINQVLPENATKEQKEMLETAIMMNPDNPAQGYAELRKAAKAEWEALLATPIKAMKEGARKGRNLYLPDEQGNLKMRNTPGENATWYSNFYNIFKREPTKKEYEDMAVALLTGDPSAPEVQGWTIDSLEAQQGMEQNKANIERIRGNLKALQEIKSAAESLTGVEMQLTEGLSPEGFKMYRQLSDWLRNVGGATARQARMGAILAARHADIYAAKVTERTGKKYTAEDYMRDKIGFSLRRADAGLNQLAGVNAINAPLEALERAKAMEAAAAYSDDIYKETGWIKGQDGKWRFEIPDNLDAVNWDVFKKGNKENKSRLLKYVYKNQKLYEAYPWLENINVEVRKMEGNTYGGVAKNNNGSYIVINEDVGDEQKSGTLIHEIQHLIQDEEGFAVGGTDENANEQIIDRIRELSKRIQSYDYGTEYADTVMDQQEMILEGVENPEAEEILKSQIAELEKKIPAKERDEIWQLALDRQYLREALNENTGTDNSLYRNLAGEQEARHATERAIIHTNVDRAEKTLAEMKEKYEAEKAKQSPAMKEMMDELEALREKDEKTDAEFDRIDEIQAAMDDKLMQAETFYSWAKDTLEMRKREVAETPQPHNDNAIVVFGGQEMAMSQEGLKGEILNQRAWHGSPYDFETFDLGAIGTGEGAQAHGWGLYFAQDKGVSKAYKERLTPDVESIDYYEIGGKQYAHDKRGKWVRLERRGDTWTEHDITPFERAVLFTFDKAEQDAQKAAESLKERLSGKNTPGDKAIQQGIDVLSGGVEKKNWKNSGGRLFDVEIPDNDVLLDEQKTLGEQPNINRLLEEYAEKTQDRSFTAGEINDEETTGEELYDWMVTILGSPKAASEELNKMGIKGITYEGARDGRCFVVFDDKAIDVIEKYNQQVRQQQVKGQTSLQANGKRIVSILESADESTFMHEMAHVFLYDLQDLAQIDDVSAKELEIVNEWANWQKGAAAEYKSTPWAKEFAAREQAIIDAEAAGDYERADQLKREWRQERFARGFELYLKDGQAPAKGLKAVFRKFKQFLRQIYAAFVSDGGKPTLPVKRVMNRMIASEQEIEAMELEDRYADVEKAGGAKLFDESEEDTYNRWYQEAEAEAKEKLLKIVMKDLEKGKQAQFDAEIEKVTSDKRKELQQEPVYLAEQAVLASGDEKMALEWFPSIEAFREELASTPPLEEALNDYMEKYSTDLDSRLIEAHMSPEAVEKALKTSKYRVKMEALKGKAMAKKLGLINKINSKAEMAMASIEEKLMALPEDTDLKVDSDSAGVKAIMAEINKLKFSAKWNKDELNHIESMIRAATQDEMRKAIADLRESKALDKEKEREILQANEGRQKIFRDIARQAMQEKKISDSCNVNYYVQQEKKMARRVRDMIRAKRWDMAMQAQEQQGMYTAMAEIAEQNREERNRLLSQVQRELAARTVRLPKNERYWHRKLAYILRINKTEPMPPEQGYVELSALLKNMEDSLDILEHSLDSVLSIANQGENFRGYKDLTMDEFKEAVNSLHVIYTVGRDKFKMKTVSGKSLFDVVDESIHEEKTVAGNIEVDTRKVNPDKGGLAYSELIGNTGDVGHLIAKRGQDYIASSVKPENILKMIGSTAHRYIYGTLEKAAENEAKMQAKNIETLRDIMSVYTHKERQDWSKKIYVLSTEKGDKISKEQIMCMALNWGTLSNRQRLLGGLASDKRTPEAVGKMTEEVMRLFEETMTAKDWQVIQKLWDHISSYWEDTVKVEEKLNGTTLEKVHATPFTITSADGQEMNMRGGYMPIKYDAEKSSRAEENETNELVQSIHAGVQRLGAGRSYTKSRTEFDMWDPLKLEFSVVESHLQDVIHNATYRLPVRDVYRIITNKQFEEHVVNHLGREYHNILKDWALDSWRQFNPNTNTADNFISWGLGKLRGNSTMAIMGYRVWAAIENISNLPIAASKIGTGQMMAALCDFYPGLIDNMKSIKQKSLFMRNRLDNLDRDIRSQAGIFHADNKLFEFARDHAYDFLVYTDLMVSAPLWMRAYKKAYEPMVQKVKEENEANIAYLLKCQAEVDSIRAEIADLRGEAKAMDEHLKERRYASPETAEMLRQSPFAMHTDNDLRAISGENLKKAKAKEKDLWEAEVKFQEAQEIKILSDDEILDEAENRAVLEADGAVRDTFGSGRTIDLPAVQRSKNEITKLLTTFYGFFNTQFNAVYMSYVNSKYLPAENAITKWAPFAKQIVFRFVFPALIGSVLQYGLGLAGGSDDEKKRKVKDANGKTVEVDIPSYERFLKVFTKNVISTGTGSMYLVRDVVNAVSDFVINDKTYGINSGSVAGRGASEVGKMFVLLSKKGQKDAEIQAKAEKKEREHQEKLAKLKGKKRQEYLKKYEENKQYEKPPKRITYAEIAGHGLKGLSSFTAAQTGITSTMVNAVTSTMQYLLDSDMRYDPTWKNIIWSALFDKKPVEREIPKRPPAEPKTKKKKKKSSSDGK